MSAKLHGKAFKTGALASDVEALEILINEAKRRGIDIIDLITKALNLDLHEQSRVRLEIAEKFLGEGVNLIDKDPVQASEELYKAAGEAVKALATALGLDEARALEQGRWTTQPLFDAVDHAADKLGKREIRWWRSAWVLHVEGFHEARLRPDQIRRDVPDIEALVNLARNILGA